MKWYQILKVDCCSGDIKIWYNTLMLVLIFQRPEVVVIVCDLTVTADLTIVEVRWRSGKSGKYGDVYMIQELDMIAIIKDLQPWEFSGKPYSCSMTSTDYIIRFV